MGQISSSAQVVVAWVGVSMQAEKVERLFRTVNIACSRLKGKSKLIDEALLSEIFDNVKFDDTGLLRQRMMPGCSFSSTNLFLAAEEVYRFEGYRSYRRSAG